MVQGCRTCTGAPTASCPHGCWVLGHLSAPQHPALQGPPPGTRSTPPPTPFPWLSPRAPMGSAPPAGATPCALAAPMGAGGWGSPQSSCWCPKPGRICPHKAEHGHGCPLSPPRDTPRPPLWPQFPCWGGPTGLWGLFGGTLCHCNARPRPGEKLSPTPSWGQRFGH